MAKKVIKKKKTTVNKSPAKKGRKVTKVTKKTTLSKTKKNTTLSKVKKAGKKVAKKKKKEEDKYIRVSAKANIKRFVELGERVQRGEVKWSHYAVDGNAAYHHYLVLKK